MSLGMPLILADETEGLLRIAFAIAVVVVVAIVKALQQRKQTGPPPRPTASRNDEEPIELQPDGTPRELREMTMEEVTRAIRQAEQERAARRLEAQQRRGQTIRPQDQVQMAQRAAQQRAQQQRVLQQRAAQERAGQLAAQQRAAQVAAQQRAGQQRVAIRTQQAEAGQPLTRPGQRMAATAARRQVQDVQELAQVESVEVAETVEQRHLQPSVAGQGVMAEEARMRGHLQQEDADRTRRLSAEDLGRLRIVAAAAPVRAVSAVGEMHLNSPAEIGRAVLYSVIIGPPLALRDQPPSWEM